MQLHCCNHKSFHHISFYWKAMFFVFNKSIFFGCTQFRIRIFTTTLKKRFKNYQMFLTSLQKVDSSRKSSAAINGECMFVRKCHRPGSNRVLHSNCSQLCYKMDNWFYHHFVSICKLFCVQFRTTFAFRQLLLLLLLLMHGGCAINFLHSQTQCLYFN